MSNIKMNKGEKISSYFMRITDLRNQLSSIGHICDGKELTIMALKGLPSSWDTFRQGVCSRSKLPKFERLKADCIQEECMEVARGQNVSSSKEELHVLSTQVNKKKRKFKGRKKHTDFSKMQCYRCDKFGHPTCRCSDRVKPQASFATTQNSNGNFEHNAFYSALSNEASTKSSTWVIDSGASQHITGFKGQLDSLQEDYVDEVAIGDDTRYPTMGIGTCTIHLKSRKTIELTKVLYVPGIKRNLLSISALEDEGLIITFMEGKVLAWPKNSNIKNAYKISSRHGCLYQINYVSHSALIHDSFKENEIWHRRLGHLHF
jgi:hypothetical protein